MSDGGHAHGGTGVTGVGLEGGIDLGLSISMDSYFSLLVGRGVVKRGNSVKKEKKKKRPILEGSSGLTPRESPGSEWGKLSGEKQRENRGRERERERERGGE